MSWSDHDPDGEYSDVSADRPGDDPTTATVRLSLRQQMHNAAVADGRGFSSATHRRKAAEHAEWLRAAR